MLAQSLVLLQAAHSCMHMLECQSSVPWSPSAPAPWHELMHQVGGLTSWTIKFIFSAQTTLLPFQARKAAQKVKRDGMAHEMARYDKGSMFLNLITSKKTKTKPEPEPLGQPLQVTSTFFYSTVLPLQGI